MPVGLLRLGWQPHGLLAEKHHVHFKDVTAPAPPRLTFPPAADTALLMMHRCACCDLRVHHEIQSQGDGGVFRRLKPTAGRTDTQQTVTVGNVADGIGTAAITVSGNSDNKIYEGEKDKNIEIVFTATGPMYDVDANRDGDVEAVVPTC